jgi:hypothetical protein
MLGFHNVLGDKFPAVLGDKPKLSGTKRVLFKIEHGEPHGD